MEFAPNVDKCPEKYDAYRAIESALHREIAETELREAPDMVEQALQQMREWIAKNPSIKTCRTDASFLLRFLRVRKFNHLAACETLERYLAMRQRNTDWFRKMDTADGWVEEVLDGGFVMPLGRNQHGQLVLLIRYGGFDYDKYGAVEQLRLLNMMLETYYEDDLTQIAGMEFIIDHSETTMKMVAIWGLSDVKRYIDCINKALPMRVKKVHIVSLPLFAATLGEWALACCSEKLRNRVQCHRSMDDLITHIDKSLLLTDNGGDQSKDELLTTLKKRMRRYRDVLLGLDDMEINEKASALAWNDSTDKDIDSGTIGSFRKLTVD